jgi:PleD family two-component response regulator
MDDRQIHETIEQLVAEEHRLWEQRTGSEHSEADARKLAELKVALDTCWDLLRQRRALQEQGLDPSAAHAREESVVEGYEQ